MFRIPGLVLLLLMIQTGLVFGQSKSIRGTITDSTGDPIPGVNISVPTLLRGTTSDLRGRYVLEEFSVDTVTVVFSFLGYRKEVRLVRLDRPVIVLDVVLEEQVADLEEVTIVEDKLREQLERATQSVTVLEAAELEDLRGQTLGQTVGQLPGVTALSTGPSIQKPVIRGLHSDRVVILNDGVRQEGQQWGAEHAPEIDPFAGTRIEVIRGAAGVEYGAGAIAGVIRIEDEALPSSPGLSGQVSLNGFSNNSQLAGSVKLEGSDRRVPGLGIRVQGSARRAGAARAPDYVLGNTGFFERSGEVAIGLIRGPLDLESHFSHYGTDLGIYSGSHFNTFAALDTVLALGRPPVEYSFDYQIDAPKQTITHDVLALRGHYTLIGGAHIESNYGLQINRRKEYDSDRVGGRDPLARAAFDLELITQTLTTKFQSKPGGVLRGDGYYVLGIDGATQGNRSEIGYLIPNYRSYSAGVFARSAFVRGPLTLEAGGRIDSKWMQAFPREGGGQGDFIEYDENWTGVSGVVGAIWSFAESWSVASNASLAWRPPSINELFSYGIHHGTSQFEIGNSDLRPEQSLGLDFTLRHASESASLELSTFANRIQEYLFLEPSQQVVVTVRGVFPEFIHTQTDALLAGLDGAASISPVTNLTLSADGSLVRGTDIDSDQPLISIPADRLTASAELDIGSLGNLTETALSLGSTLVRRQDRYPTQVDASGMTVPVDYSAPPPGYTLFRLGLSSTWNLGETEVNFSVSAENIFDVEYRDYLSRYRYFAHDPGRNVIVRIHIPFN